MNREPVNIFCKQIVPVVRCNPDRAFFPHCKGVIRIVPFQKGLQILNINCTVVFLVVAVAIIIIVIRHHTVAAAVDNAAVSQIQHSVTRAGCSEIRDDISGFKQFCDPAFQSRQEFRGLLMRWFIIKNLRPEKIRHMPGQIRFKHMPESRIVKSPHEGRAVKMKPPGR